MLPLAANSRVIRSPDLIATEMDGDIVIMHVNSDQYVGISGVGPRIRTWLERPMTIEQITNTIVSEYRVDEQICRGDILIFVQAFLDQGSAQII